MRTLLISKFIIAFNIFTACLAHGKGGDVVGNGGGLAELNAVYIWTHISEIVRPCLMTNCGLSRSEKDLLEKINLALDREKQFGGLKITNEVKNPEIFPPQSQKIVDTKFSDSGEVSPIYLNATKLYRAVEGRLVPLSFKEIGTQILAALAAHHGLALSPKSFEFGARIMQEWREYREGVRLVVSHSGEFSWHVLKNTAGPIEQNLVIVEDNASSHDVTMKIQGALLCPFGQTPQANFTLTASELTVQEANNALVIGLAKNKVQYKCQGSSSSSTWQGTLFTKLPFQITSDGSLAFLMDNMQFLLARLEEVP